MALKLSGLQKDILSLYRVTLREIRKKPTENIPSFRRFARAQFDLYKTVDAKDFNTIEFLLRKGRRQLETYKVDEVKNINF